MALERFVNSKSPSDATVAATAISGSLSSGATSVTFVDTTYLPSAAQFRIVLENERILVTNLVGAVGTITRGIEQTTAAAHADGTAVMHVLTAAGLANNPLAMTTAGDLPYLDSTLSQARLAAGADGTYLRYASGIPTVSAIQAADLPDLSTSYVSATATRTANRILAGPASGSAAAATFRALVSADIPDLSATYATPASVVTYVSAQGFATGGGSATGANTGDQFTSVTASRLVGRGSAAGAGAGQEIMLGTNLAMSGTTLNASAPDLSGYVVTTRTVNGHALSADVTVTKSDLSLGNVENTALSTWAGSTNLTTLGAISTGSWNATAIPVGKGGTGSTFFAVAGPTVTRTYTFPDADSTVVTLSASQALSNKTGNISQWTNDSSYTTLGAVAGVGYLTSVTAHNLLSATHGDTLAASVTRGAIIYGNSTPKWATLVAPGALSGLSHDGTDVSWVTATGAGAPVRATSPVFATSIAIGTTVASAGDIRLANGAIIYARNSGNTGDVILVQSQINQAILGGNSTVANLSTFWSTNIGNGSFGSVNALYPLTLGNANVSVYGEAANVWGQRSGASAQKSRLYNAFTAVDTAGEWFEQAWESNIIRLGAMRGSSSGTSRVLTIDYGGVQGGTKTAAMSVPITSGNVTFGGGITLADAGNIVIDVTTGTKLGTATGQKLGFWNQTPVVQQVLATGASHTVDDVITFMQTVGLCKQS